MHRPVDRLYHPVRLARLNADMKQIDLAVKAGVSEKTIRNIEEGISPHRATQVVVAGALDKPVSELWPPLRPGLPTQNKAA